MITLVVIDIMVLLIVTMMIGLIFLRALCMIMTSRPTSMLMPNKKKEDTSVSTRRQKTHPLRFHEKLTATFPKCYLNVAIPPSEKLLTLTYSRHSLATAISIGVFITASKLGVKNSPFRHKAIRVSTNVRVLAGKKGVFVGGLILCVLKLFMVFSLGFLTVG